MNDLEQKLQSQRLASPSAGLDRHMGETFATAQRTAAEKRRTRVWWWLVPATVAGGVAAVILVALDRSLPAVVPVVYRIEAEGRLREMLLNPVADHEKPPPPFAVRGNVP